MNYFCVTLIGYFSFYPSWQSKLNESHVPEPISYYYWDIWVWKMWTYFFSISYHFKINSQNVGKNIFCMIWILVIFFMKFSRWLLMNNQLGFFIATLIWKGSKCKTSIIAGDEKFLFFQIWWVFVSPATRDIGVAFRRRRR